MVSQRNLYLTLIFATFAVSWSSIIIKFTDAAAMANAFYRMVFASIILAIPAIPRIIETYPGLSKQQIVLLITSGLALALHFATWITSLYYTTISNSVILVSTSPLFLMIMEALIFKEKIARKSIIGMIVALIGMVVISGGDVSFGIDLLWGDLLALAGALFVGFYLLIGRKLRGEINNLEYIFIVYFVASLFLLIIALSGRTNLTDYKISTWLLFLLLALIPTVIGHSLYNWVLKYIPAYRVATVILGEPIGATILAIIIFNQIPGWYTLIGGFLILAGVFAVLHESEGQSVMPNS